MRYSICLGNSQTQKINKSEEINDKLKDTVKMEMNERSEGKARSHVERKDNFDNYRHIKLDNYRYLDS